MSRLAALNFALLLGMCAVTAAAGMFVWLRLRAPGARVLALLLLACALNSGAFALEFVTDSLTAKVVVEKILIVSATAIPTLWFVFALQYTGRGRYLTRTVLVFLVAVPLAIFLLAWSNETHHLFWRGISVTPGDAYLAAELAFGPAYWVHIVYVNALLAAGTVLLLQLFWRSWSLYRGQAVALLAAVSIPWLAETMYLGGLSPVHGIDLVSVSLCVAALLLAFGFTRLRTADVLTVSRAAILDSLVDAVMVLGPDANVLYRNPAGAALLEHLSPETMPKSLARVWPQTLLARTDDPVAVTERATVSWLDDDASTFDLSLSPIVDASGQAVARVLVVRDVSDLKRAERGLLESLAMQKTVTDGVIAALARTVEVRDPYTAGHQRRVAELAAAMALQMLGEESVEGLRVAGMLHDVGKINIPAEILSKPALLSEMEFKLIKGHAQAGFEILEAIHFPWRVAEMALQHHERQDGSGYPAGLRGDQILPEARILAVADVVEAMASHRPYRAALGLEAALAEVHAGAGTRYDADAVATCESVFANGFVFTEP